MLIKKICVLILLSNFVNNIFASSSDDIVGFWLSEEKTAVIETFKENKKIFGKIVWIKDIHDKKMKDKLDINNPNKELRTKSLLGLRMIKDFKFEDGEWIGGTVYDPEGGKVYKGVLKLKDKDTLDLKGYIGIPLFGRSSVWAKQKSSIPNLYIKESVSRN